jgi:hypothetical protein
MQEYNFSNCTLQADNAFNAYLVSDGKFSRLPVVAFNHKGGFHRAMTFWSKAPHIHQN